MDYEKELDKCPHYTPVPYAIANASTSVGIKIHKKRAVEFYLPPDTNTPSELIARVLTMAWWPEKFCRKLPSGSFHILMLSGDPLAKQNLQRRGKGRGRQEIWQVCVLILSSNTGECVSIPVQGDYMYIVPNKHNSE